MTQPFASPDTFVTDSDTFAPPTYGGAVAVKFATVEYTDTTAKNLFTLPEGAVIVDWSVNVSTAFNDGASNQLDIGITGTADYFANNLNVGSVGQIRTGFVPSRIATTPLTEDTLVTATYTPGTSAGAGVATVIVFYILR